MFDMSKCKIGDKLVNAGGFIYELVRIEGGDYPYCLIGSDGTVPDTSRTEGGKFYKYADSEFDIVGFYKKEPAKRVRKAKPVNKLLGLCEWVTTVNATIKKEYKFISGTITVVDKSVQFEYYPNWTSGARAYIVQGETCHSVTTLNNFKGAVTKLLK